MIANSFFFSVLRRRYSVRSKEIQLCSITRVSLKRFSCVLKFPTKYVFWIRQ